MQHKQLARIEQHQQSIATAIHFVKAQLVLTIVISILCLYFGVVVAYSALSGGLIATLANAWFAYKVFRISPDNSAETMLVLAYIGEIYKMVLTVALFICVFVLVEPLSVVTFLISYFVIHVAPTLVCVYSTAVGNNANLAKRD